MKIVCPYCHYSKDVDPAKIPVNASRATCPKCRRKFTINVADGVGFDVGSPSSGDSGLIPDSSITDQKAAMVEGADQAQAGLASVSRAPSGEAPEEATPVMPPPPPPDETYGSIPWEDRTGGFFGDFFSTVKMVLFSPTSFFDRLPVRAGKKGPLLFGIVCGSLGAYFQIVWWLGFILVGNSFFPSEVELLPQNVLVIGAVAYMIVIPLFYLVGLFLWAAIQHLFFLIVRGGGGGFQATLRVLAYAQAAQLFNVVPLIGWPVSFIWGLVIMVLGFTRVHRTGVLRVLTGMFVIPILLLIGLAVGMTWLANWLVPEALF